jgi:hypothetical protein
MQLQEEVECLSRRLVATERLRVKLPPEDISPAPGSSQQHARKQDDEREDEKEEEGGEARATGEAASTMTDDRTATKPSATETRPETQTESELETEAAATVAQLAEARHRMQLAVQSGLAAQQSLEEQTSADVSAAGGECLSPESLLWQNLALELELEDLDEKKHEESGEEEDCDACAVRGGRLLLPNPSRIDPDTLEEESAPPSAGSDDLDCHAAPVVISTAPGPASLSASASSLETRLQRGSEEAPATSYYVCTFLLNHHPHRYCHHHCHPHYYHPYLLLIGCVCVCVCVAQREQVPALEQVLKEGFLMKRGFLNTAFQRRWCVLK